jgi:hypothetical protein
MRERLIQHFLPHSAKLQHNKPTAHGQWRMHVTNSLIMLPLTQIQAFDTKLATWYFWHTQMPPTFLKLVVKAEQQDIFTYQIAITKTSTMAPYSHCRQSSNMSCHQHLRPNLPHSTMAASLLHHFEPLLRNSATSSQLPLSSPPTTSLPKAVQWEQWHPRLQKKVVLNYNKLFWTSSHLMQEAYCRCYTSYASPFCICHALMSNSSYKQAWFAKWGYFCS